MDIKNCYCVIMAGGVGKRFWPLSRTSVPKQFLDVAETGALMLLPGDDSFEFVSMRGK